MHLLIICLFTEGNAELTWYNLLLENRYRQTFGMPAKTNLICLHFKHVYLQLKGKLLHHDVVNNDQSNMFILEEW